MSDEPERSTDEPAAVTPAPEGVRVSALTLGCTGVITCVLALVAMFISLLASGMSFWMFGAWVLAILLLFVQRVRNGPSPLLSAVAVGAAIALVICGSCLALITTGGRIGG